MLVSIGPLLFLVVPPENHSWSQVPGDLLEQETCYRITVFASTRPENVTSWWTVLSAYHFRGNGEWPQGPAKLWGDVNTHPQEIRPE